MARWGYHYTVNGEIAYSQNHVQDILKKMGKKSKISKKPIVIKFERWSNGKTSKRKIPVKLNVNEYFTIL